MNVEEDTATGENVSTKIIDKDGITTARAEATEDVLHFKTGESKEESYARYYDYLKKATENPGGPIRIGEVGQVTTIINYGDQDATKGDTNFKMIEGRPQSELR